MFLAWCVLTALTGACHTVSQFALVRGLFGVAEGAVANPLNKLENQWVLPHERGWAYGMLLACGYLGIISGMLLVGWLISLWGWRAMFYGTGALTLLGVVFGSWSMTTRDNIRGDARRTRLDRRPYCQRPRHL
jgi:MFS family permease